MKKKTSFFKRVYSKISSYIVSNRLFFSYTMISLLTCVLTRQLTVGAGYDIRSLVVELAIILILGSFCYLKRPTKRFSYLFKLICFYAALGAIHTVYYKFYTSFGSIGDIATLSQAETVTGSIFEKIKIENIFFLIIPFFFYYIHNHLKSSSYYNYITMIENSKKVFIITLVVGISLFGMRFIFATNGDYNCLKTQWNKSSVVQRFGIIFYQTNDVVQMLKPRINSIFGYEDAFNFVKNYYDERDNKYDHANKYTGIIEGKNIILVHMESIQNFLMDLSFNGKEVTPNLNKLAKEGMFFSNFYPEVSTGTSSDTEFTLLSSLMPAASGTVFVSYYNRDYVTIPKLLLDNDYYTFSMHGNLASMWNRNRVHPELGYEGMYYRESFEYTDEDVINLGINDKVFFKQAIPILEEIETEHEKYMGTVITLSNHSPFNGGEKYGVFDLSSKVDKYDNSLKKNVKVETDYLSDTPVGRYIKSSHYADEALGEFINYIKKSDKFNDTIFVFYGDHDARLSHSEMNYLYNYNPLDGSIYTEEDPEYQPYDLFDHELNKKTPLIIWTKNNKLKSTFKGNIKYFMGMIDVQPTLLNMLNIKNKYALGHDIFNIKNENVIPFPNGNFLSSSIYYKNSTGEFKVFNDNTVIGMDYIEDKQKDVEQRLNVSNMIIVYDLLAKMNE